MQLSQIEETRGAEGYAPDLRFGCTGPRMIPGADHEIVPRAPLGRGILHVAAIMLERPDLVVVVTRRNRQDRDPQRRVLRGRGVIPIPVSIGFWMCDPLLERGRGVSQHGIEITEWTTREIPLAVERRPKMAVRKNAWLQRAAA